MRAEIASLFRNFCLFQKFHIFSIHHIKEKGNSPKGEAERMESRLIKQAVIFLLIAFAWTIFFLAIGPK